MGCSDSLSVRTLRALKKDMAKFEIHKRFGPKDGMWWKFVPGTIVTVKWPSGLTAPDHLGNQTESADPNDHYRPWLEKNVGRQGWDWNWRIADTSVDSLEIKFRVGKSKLATMAALKWT